MSQETKITKFAEQEKEAFNDATEAIFATQEIEDTQTKIAILKTLRTLGSFGIMLQQLGVDKGWTELGEGIKEGGKVGKEAQ